MGIRADPALSFLLLTALVGAETHEGLGVSMVGPVQYDHLTVTCHLFSYLECQIIGVWTVCV